MSFDSSLAAVRLPTRLPIKNSIFAEITHLAHKLQALNLGQGYIEQAPAASLLELLNYHARKSPHHYSPPEGLLSLRQVVAELIKQVYDVFYDPEKEITITAGATEGIWASVLAATMYESEVIILEPAYESYTPSVVSAGANPVYFPLQPPNFSLSWAHLRACITSRTRAIILNSPHNPTGYILQEEDWENLARLLAGKDIVLISDEAYELWQYTGKPTSLRQHPALRERSFIVGSLGKLLGVPGWRLGYVAAPAPMTAALRNLKQHITYCAPVPLQYAAADYIKHFSQELSLLPQKFLANKQKLEALLSQKGWSYLAPQGGIFLLAELPPYLSAGNLLEKHLVATVPLEAFYHRNPSLNTNPTSEKTSTWVRLCFARTESTWQEALQRLSTL
ncbi:MAG: aminotransferase class I/II-fold pyridoxal phosphate-dependent enzyme [Bacteroidia bacterium]